MIFTNAGWPARLKSRLRRWRAAILLAVLCGVIFGVVRWRLVSRPFSAVALVECLPPDQATHVYLNVSALRTGGVLDLLAGSKAAEEPDYRRFVEQTGFDYRNDLDEAAAAFLRGSVYFAVRGRFDWKKLDAYANAQGGSCRNSVCEMPASEPGRHISFYPIRSNILALAVSFEERGVNLIGPSQWTNPPQLPPDPVWISAPSFIFADAKNLPEGTHAFLSPLAQAQRVVFAIGPDGQQLRIRVEVTCDSAEAAAALSGQLTKSTDLLNKMLARQHMTPNARDLSAVLAGGKFEQKDRTVTGAWPMDRGFLETLASGSQ
jgi:hypothetical protein